MNLLPIVNLGIRVAVTQAQSPWQTVTICSLEVSTFWVIARFYWLVTMLPNVRQTEDALQPRFNQTVNGKSPVGLCIVMILALLDVVALMLMLTSRLRWVCPPMLLPLAQPTA
ncbi:hypothetical protein FGIG_10422 [Fasciola gigantica]|uniref:Uncharacterized protein n=1 Tax=Fasciola gigantica TaxID=46835 RepID=A0A504Y913_FASGI|nr:hypothetical protein FGIG_10422 [Fasciola gigantica]